MNLYELLLEKSIRSDIGVTLIDSNDQEQFLSYAQLRISAEQALVFLQHKGLNPKDELVFQLEDNKTFIIVFWACILGGIIPVPLSIGATDDQRQKVFNVWNILNNPYLITTDESINRLEKFAVNTHQEDGFKTISNKFLSVQQLFDIKGKACLYEPQEDGIAYIQFSSGSTGTPKGITLTHKNLITNINAILKGIQSPVSGDTFFSWMPLTHDMGLIGFHLTPLLAGWHHYIMPTTLFIRNPLLWLKKISQYKITFTASPNFGYRYVINRFDEKALENLDLSSLRIIVNGAEPISPDLCKEFTVIFSKYGLHKEAIFPVYGLAEASLAVTFSEPGEPVKSLTLDRTNLLIHSKVQEVNEGLMVTNVGKAIQDCSIKITDDKKNKLNDLTIGKVLIKGDNVTTGYYNNTLATDKIFSEEGWLDTGDLGFIKDGDLFITGRYKDVIFVNGQNYYSHDIENSLEKLNEIEQGKIAVSAFTNSMQSEEILIFVSHKKNAEAFKSLRLKIKRHINLIFGFTPDHVIPVQAIPKTTSGKIQRFKLVEQYKAGLFEDVLKGINESLSNGSAHVEPHRPSNDLKLALIKIWAEVLDHSDFNANSNFFEIGGNSLKGAQILFHIHQDFNINLDYSVLFEKLTIQELSKEIENALQVQFRKISKITEADSYNLSSSQKRLYYLWDVEKSSIAYNIPVALQVNTHIDVNKLKEALSVLIDRHEMLRATFHFAKEQPYMSITKHAEVQLETMFISNEQLDQELKKSIQPFDLNHYPLFRVKLLKLSDDTSILFFDAHHIIADGISINILLEELLKSYFGEQLDTTETQFKDYIHWQVNEEKLLEAVNRNYWTNKFNDHIPVLNFPTDYARPSLFDYQGKKLKFSIDAQLTKKLKVLALEENSSLFILLFSCYNVLLSTYTGQSDIVVGVPVALRNHIQLQQVAGMFVNNLVLRTGLKADQTFRSFLREVRKNTLNDLNHQNYSFENLLKDIGPQRNMSRNVFFDTMFVYQNISIPKIKNNAIVFEPYYFDPGFSKFDITMEIVDTGNELNYFLEYATSLFDQDSIIGFSNCFTTLLNQLVEDPDKKLADLSVINEEEHFQFIREFNNTHSPYPKTKTIQALFQEQALRTPERIAVKEGGGSNKALSLTYREVDEKSNMLANWFDEKRMKPNEPVAVIMDRTPNLILVVLAILKSGRCFIPIDKDLPSERINFIMNNSGATILVIDNTGEEKIQISGNYFKSCLIVNIDTLYYTNKSNELYLGRKSSDRCYMIYTSGTTGHPKGTVINQRSLLNYLTWAKKQYLKKQPVSFPLYTSISFDLTLTSLFLPLITGNTIITYPDREHALAIEDVVLDNQVQIIKATPSHLKILAQSSFLKEQGGKSKLHTFIVGGESFPTPLAETIHRLFNGKVILHNEYGPTEATIGCMIHTYDIEKDDRQSVPIGAPINNTFVYILDNNLHPIPKGVIGELYIGGDCLANGYWLNEALTNEKFIADPFRPGKLMYKSGDLVKMLSGERIEFLGRVDKMVKINGYRIELEEIEKQIYAYTGIKDALVICKTDEHQKEYLSAYICKEKTADTDRPIDDQFVFVNELKAFLAKHLPSYMIPRYITEIQMMPLTRNGKVDEKLLPEPIKYVKTEPDQSLNEIQKNVLEVWKTLFLNDKISIHDNFFDLGGDSIKAVQISSSLMNQKVYIKAKDILIYQTIEQVCKNVNTNYQFTEYEQGIVNGEVGLTPISKWFFEQNFKNPNHYNQSVLLKFKTRINKQKIEQALFALINHHDGLRLNYNADNHLLFYNSNHLNSVPVVEEYVINPELKIDSRKDGGTAHLNEDTTDIASNAELEHILKKAYTAFDISATLLIKAIIIRDRNSEMLFITAHHLVVDGISWRIILDDFYSFCKETALLPKRKTGSLIDYYNTCIAKSRNITDEELAYWKKNSENRFTSGKDVMGITDDRKNLKIASFQLSKHDTAFLLNESHKIYNTTVEILLIAALLKTIKSCMWEKEVVIDLENHGRQLEDLDVSRTVGWFTSIFPVRFNIDHPDTSALIKYVKESIKEVPEGGTGYGILKYIGKKINTQKSTNGIRFNYLGQFSKETDNDLYTLVYRNTSKESDEQNSFGATIEINALVLDKKLQLEIIYLAPYENQIQTQQFTEGYERDIQYILEYIRQECQPQFTPSDFDAVELNNEDLDVLFG